MLTNSTKLILVLLAVLGVAGSLVLITGLTPQLPVDDFVEYWAAGRLALTGGNPYDPQQLWVLEQQAGWMQDRPLMMWNPPWTLALVAPLGLLPYPQARFFWFLVNFGGLIFSVDWLWRLYQGTPRWRFWLPLLCFTFIPTILVLKIGHLTPLMLLGCIGFLHFERQEKPFWAGVNLSLTLFKPHLMYLAWVVCVLQSLLKRNFTCMSGALAALGVELGIAFLIQPELMVHYVYAICYLPPDEWLTPTWGTLLRLGLGWDKLWLQVAPSLLGALGMGLYAFRIHDYWNWSIEFPRLTLVSIITTSYGWATDYVLLLPAIVATLAFLPRLEAKRFRLAGWLVYGVLNLGTLILWRYPALVYEGNGAPITLAFFVYPSVLWYVVIPLLWWGWYSVFGIHAYWERRSCEV